jgi:hypothetical protein
VLRRIAVKGEGSRKDGAGYGSLLRRSLYKLELRKVFFEASPRNDVLRL